MSVGETVLLDLRALGDHLVVTARRHSSPGDEQPIDLMIDVAAHPFSGVVRQLVMAADLTFFADNLRRLGSRGEVVLGGDRMVELRLAVEPQEGREGQVVDATVTPSSDDPYPTLRFLIFDQPPFAEAAAAAIDRLLR